MGKIKFLFALIIFIMVVAVGYWIGTENKQLVAPILFGFELPEWSLSTWMFIALFSGSFLGYLISLISYLPLKARNSSLQRKLARRDKEITKMKASTQKD
ncbi:MAG: lipopolysaccharide assembly protein LapA domain-containing protein [Cellvibrionaceae bacterium]